ncbi:MAG: amino acid-binding protein, partial [Phycisphaerae bacterium SM23_30]
MKLDVSKVDVWAATIKDRPGSLAVKMKALSEAGVNLEFVIARRTPEKKGMGVVFVTPIKGARQVKAAQAAGFEKTKSLYSV